MDWTKQILVANIEDGSDFTSITSDICGIYTVTGFSVRTTVVVEPCENGRFKYQVKISLDEIEIFAFANTPAKRIMQLCKDYQNMIDTICGGLAHEEIWQYFNAIRKINETKITRGRSVK